MLGVKSLSDDKERVLNAIFDCFDSATQDHAITESVGIGVARSAVEVIITEGEKDRQEEVSILYFYLIKFISIIILINICVYVC